jgi:hypothetical protein
MSVQKIQVVVQKIASQTSFSSEHYVYKEHESDYSALVGLLSMLGVIQICWMAVIVQSTAATHPTPGFRHVGSAYASCVKRNFKT